jgi:formylglycine-generating enzyme required for sulfatase activity
MLDELDGTPVHDQVQEAKQIAKGLTVGEPIVEDLVEVEQRPDRLGWREARLALLGVQSAVLAALLCGGLFGVLRWMKQWPQETVKVKQTRLGSAIDERVVCPERRKNVDAHPPVVVKEPARPPAHPPSVTGPQTPRVRPPVRQPPQPVADGGVLADAATPPDAGAAAPPDFAPPRNLAPPPRVVYRPKMIPIRPASFLMGSDTSPYNSEKPQHEVVLTVPFLMAETEVTQGQYKAVMGTNPSRFQKTVDADLLPVETVSWVDAAQYSNKLSKLEGLETCYQIIGDKVQWPKKQGCRGYRLPTEAEWEYAARAGQKTEYAGSNQVDEVAWLYSNSGGQTHPVAKKRPNAWGLYDLSGNVWEWVWDWYGGSYDSAAKENPTGPQGGSERVVRGGSWFHDAEDARVADRRGFAPSLRVSLVGFRLARSNP